jgi:hypothetical protein
VGVTLHDKDVTNIPQVRLAADGSPFLDTSGMWLVARHQVTGQVYYVQDSLIGANTVAVRLNADGTTTLISDAAAIAALTPTLLLQAVGHAFLDDMAHGVLGSLSPVTGDLTNPDAIALLNAHYIAGDGRVNENIGLTAIHDVFHAEGNPPTKQLRSEVEFSRNVTRGDSSEKIEVQGQPDHWLPQAGGGRGAGSVVVPGGGHQLGHVLQVALQVRRHGRVHDGAGEGA